MIVYITKDVFKEKGEDFIIAHQTNCMGKMGAGVALAIRKKFPEVYEHYLAEHSLGLLELGYTSYVPVGENAYVANMCGQYRYGRDKQYTDYDSLKKCLEDVKIMAESLNCDVILPYKLGCNNAGGDWRVVFVMIDEVFKDCLISEIYEGDE